MTELPASAELISLGEVVARAPSLSAEDQRILHGALNAAARRVAPCFAVGAVSPDQIAEARQILVQTIARHEDVQAWVDSVTTGPYGTRYRTSAAATSVLSSDDEAGLRALCPATAGGTGGPRGSFPEPRANRGGTGW